MLAVWKKLPYEIGPDQVSIVVFNEKPEDYEFHFYLHENMEQIDLLEAVLYCGERVDSFHVDIGLVEDVESFGFWEFFFSCLEAAHLREISLRMMLDTGAYNDALCKALSCMTALHTFTFELESMDDESWTPLELYSTILRMKPFKQTFETDRICDLNDDDKVQIRKLVDVNRTLPKLQDGIPLHVLVASQKVLNVQPYATLFYEIVSVGTSYGIGISQAEKTET